MREGACPGTGGGEAVGIPPRLPQAGKGRALSPVIASGNRGPLPATGERDTVTDGDLCPSFRKAGGGGRFLSCLQL